MALLIRNGEIVTASERYVADILCEGETITRIGQDLAAPPGAEIIDARTIRYSGKDFLEAWTRAERR